MRSIEIVFPVDVSPPDGFEQALDALVGMVCKKYERDNPSRVMWVSGYGYKSVWQEPDEPEFDDSVYQVSVSEREDCYGENGYNPSRQKLQDASHEARKAARQKALETKIEAAAIKLDMKFSNDSHLTTLEVVRIVHEELKKR